MKSIREVMIHAANSVYIAIDAGNFDAGEYKGENAPRLGRGKGGPTLPSERVPAARSTKVRTSRAGSRERRTNLAK